MTQRPPELRCVLNVRIVRPTSLSLAALYVLLVTVGHALHHHGDCRYGELPRETNHTSTAVPGSLCPCHHRGDQCDQLPSRFTPVVGQHAVCHPPQSVHDPHSCSVCLALSQLKFGYSLPGFQIAVSNCCSTTSLVYSTPGRTTINRISIPRGPPCGFFA